MLCPSTSSKPGMPARPALKPKTPGRRPLLPTPKNIPTTRGSSSVAWRADCPRPSEEALRSDLAELRARLEHLVRKLKRYLTNDKETLVVHKLADEDTRSDDLGLRLDMLERTLDDMGARNWQLLVICQDADMPRMPHASTRRIYRSVKEFNPGSKVTWPELGDPAGWHALFTEFAPKTILPKAHAFKFE